ncbi:MAG: rRNA (cytidine-2'-O-)-methyltransferase, partial [Alphaproteobacteria bacterium]
ELAKVNPNAEIAIGRELTKKFEEFIRGNAGVIDINDIPEKGEFVLLINVPKTEISESDIDAMIKTALETMSVKDASVAVSLETGLPRNKIYAKVLEIAKG